MIAGIQRVSKEALFPNKLTPQGYPKSQWSISSTVTKHPGPRRPTRWPSSPQTAQARCQCHHVTMSLDLGPKVVVEKISGSIWLSRMDILGMLLRFMEGVWRSKLQVMDAVITLVLQGSHASRRICLGAGWRRWTNENKSKMNEIDTWYLSYQTKTFISHHTISCSYPRKRSHIPAMGVWKTHLPAQVDRDMLLVRIQLELVRNIILIHIEGPRKKWQQHNLSSESGLLMSFVQYTSNFYQAWAIPYIPYCFLTYSFSLLQPFRNTRISWPS